MPEYSPRWYQVVHDVIYTFHMPLFMFVSGCVYTATMRKSGYLDFITRKARRLMLPYLATSLVVVTIKLATQGSAYVESPVSLWSYLKVLCLPEAGYYLWFIWALWWMFVAIPFFDTPRKRLSLLAVAVVLHFLPVSFGGLFCLDQTRNMLVWFVSGVVSFDCARLRGWLSQYSLGKAAAAGLTFALLHVLPSAGINCGGGADIRSSALVCRYLGSA